MPRTIGTLALMLMLLGLGGCSYFFYPRAGDYASQAKGATTLDTMINLTNMMEATAAKAKGGRAKTLRSTTTIISSMPSWTPIAMYRKSRQRLPPTIWP